MEVAQKDAPKKKAGKSSDVEKQLASEVRIVLTTDQSMNGHTAPPKEVVETPPAESKPKSGTSAVNGKEGGRPKREKNGNRSQSPVPKEKISVQNGVTDVALNAVPAATTDTNSTTTDTPAADVSPEVIEEEGLVIVTEPDNDELFPELNYDETSDTECNFDSSSPNFSPVNRSVTRRSQAKKIPTPETPQLSHSKQDALAVDCPVERPPSRNTPQPDQTMPLREKVLKIKDMYCASPRRESPAPENGSTSKKQKETDADKDEGNDSKNGSALASESLTSKTDTNYSKSRIKVSPYRRSTRLSEQYSTVANYSGNNTTQETDIVVDDDVASSSRDQSPVGDSGDDSSLNGSHSSWQKEGHERSSNYIESFRNIKGRRSFRPLREISLIKLSAQRHKATRAAQEKESEQQVASVSSVNVTVGSEPCDTITSETSSAKWTPVGHVVGRKRRQEDDESDQNEIHIPSPAIVMSDSISVSASIDQGPSKRMRLLGYAASPFRHIRDKMVSSTPIGSRYAQHVASRTSKPELTKPAGEGSIDISVAEEAMPMMNATVARKPEEHKWCAIM